VQEGLNKRLLAIKNPKWTEAMIRLIKGMKYFRWHDSGDIQNLTHLNKIFDICEGTPETKHWLPTKEYLTVTKVLDSRDLPNNLILRLAAYNVDDNFGPSVLAKKLGVQMCAVGTIKYNCKVAKDNTCGNCRKCWDKRAFNVIYKKH